MCSKRVLWDQKCSLDKGGRSRQGAREEIRLPSVHIRLGAPPLSSSASTRSRDTGMVSTPPGMQQQDRSHAQGGDVFLSNSLSRSKGSYWQASVQPTEDIHKTERQNEGVRRIRNNAHRSKRSQTREKVPSLTTDSSSHVLPLMGAESVVPFNSSSSESRCQYCGLYVTTQSIARHKNWCSRLTRQIETKSKSSVTTRQPEGQEPVRTRGKIVARVVTVGLTPGLCEQVFITSNGEEPERPETRTLPYSSLHHIGHGLPSSTKQYHDEDSRKPSGVQQCKSCDRIVASDKLDIHRHMCRRSAPHVSTRTVALPSTHSHLRVEQKLEPHPQIRAQNKPQKPPTVVCYICGHEYGSKSIAIHEPQCLKKFNIQNNKLPIKDRLPLPKKKRTVAIVRELSREEAVGLPESVQAYSNMEPREDMVQQYLEHCYSEFERDLVPCKKCGRTFAPERHIIHQPNCNAKPL